MTLLSICQDALKEDGRFNVPASIVGNSDPTAVQLLALANRTGRTLAYDNTWQFLVKVYTFSTANGTASYALPSDFHHFIDLTYWDRTNTTQMVGPVSAAVWEELQSGNVVGAGIRKYFRVYGNLFYIYPTPSASDTIAYQYYTKNWISSKAAFDTDSDAPLIDEDLLTLGVRYRFLSAKGLPYQGPYDEYSRRLASLLEKDGGKSIISFGRRLARDRYEGIPETGFG